MNINEITQFILNIHIINMLYKINILYDNTPYADSVLNGVTIILRNNLSSDIHIVINIYNNISTYINYHYYYYVNIIIIFYMIMMAKLHSFIEKSITDNEITINIKVRPHLKKYITDNFNISICKMDINY